MEHNAEIFRFNDTEKMAAIFYNKLIGKNDQWTIMNEVCNIWMNESNKNEKNLLKMKNN